MTEIKSCTCKNTMQDEMYGAGNRLHNFNAKNQPVCTVCRKTDGFRGKTAVRKHPSATKAYKIGDKYESCLRYA